MATLSTGLSVTTSSTGITTAAEFSLTRQQNQVRVTPSTDLYARVYTGGTAAAALAAALAGSAVATTIALAKANEYMFIPLGQTKTLFRSPQPQYVALSVISLVASVVTVEGTVFYTG